ncbi:PqqD family peptide modification chaperone [Embleya sp. NPDC127516]|uniref:PqqD family peptide modification chaperone n=1 Tax=Embleya sp. NPDC127516 TaxID=3363990 RepID=UPI0038111237
MTTHRVTAPHVVCEHGAALVDMRAGDLVFLNPSAGRVLAHLAAGIDTTVIATRIGDATGAPADVVERDVRALVDALARRGLLGETNTPSVRRNRR